MHFFSLYLCCRTKSHVQHDIQTLTVFVGDFVDILVIVVVRFVVVGGVWVLGGSAAIWRATCILKFLGLTRHRLRRCGMYQEERFYRGLQNEHGMVISILFELYETFAERVPQGIQLQCFTE